MTIKTFFLSVDSTCDIWNSLGQLLYIMLDKCWLAPYCDDVRFHGKSAAELFFLARILSLFGPFNYASGPQKLTTQSQGYKENTVDSQTYSMCVLQAITFYVLVAYNVNSTFAVLSGSAFPLRTHLCMLGGWLINFMASRG